MCIHTDTQTDRDTCTYMYTTPPHASLSLLAWPPSRPPELVTPIHGPAYTSGAPHTHTHTTNHPDQITCQSTQCTEIK